MAIQGIGEGGFGLGRGGIGISDESDQSTFGWGAYYGHGRGDGLWALSGDQF